MLLDQHVNVPV